MVICLERGADLHMAQLMPLPLIVSCFSEIQIGFTFLVPAHPGSPGQRAVKRVCVCVCVPADDILHRPTVGLCPSNSLAKYVNLCHSNSWINFALCHVCGIFLFQKLYIRYNRDF